MKNNILQIILISLLSISLFGCGNKEEKASSPAELKGVCKEAYDAHMKFFGDPMSQKIFLKNGITKENYEKDLIERYTDADEEYCRGGLNNVNNTYTETNVE